ncbi:MAG TPA: triose-phosphate isomerase [Casimicrobiaceae bacterium]|nr:triose-phosphate isomerase [Casimicrobiaceae bacterium]
MRETFVVGNWKMNGSRETNAPRLTRLASGWQAGAGRRLAVCVPAPYMQQAQAALTGSAVAWGAQDVSEHASGAYTGDVAASMVTDFGGTFAIVGHSERRQAHGESDARVGAKAKAALAAGLTPVACVGETLDERERGDTEAVVLRELDALLAALGKGATRMVVAYEPIWAIGTGRTASPAEAQAVHATLRARLAAVGAGDVPVLYGGSVKAANAAALFAMPDIDGALVGGASLDAEEFLRIGRA